MKKLFENLVTKTATRFQKIDPNSFVAIGDEKVLITDNCHHYKMAYVSILEETDIHHLPDGYRVAQFSRFLSKKNLENLYLNVSGIDPFPKDIECIRAKDAMMRVYMLVPRGSSIRYFGTQGDGYYGFYEIECFIRNRDLKPFTTYGIETDIVRKLANLPRSKDPEYEICFTDFVGFERAVEGKTDPNRISFERYA